MPLDDATYHAASPIVPPLETIIARHHVAPPFNEPTPLQQLDYVTHQLADEDRWCKQQLRSYDGRRCLLGAMMAADATITLKAPILAAIRDVTGRDYLRIEMFNDHPLTTHRLVRRVLDRARYYVENPGAISATAPKLRWYQRLIAAFA